jgi:O-antigen/teichoic acid export membrane protein
MQSLTLSGLIRYTLVNAPWPLLTTLSYGLSNYVTILIVTGSYGMMEAGRFRLFLTIAELLSIFSLADTGKILVKHLTLGKPGIVMPLLRHRAQFALIGSIAGAGLSYVFYARGDSIWLPVAVVSLLLPLTYPADLYNPIDMAKRQFRSNAGLNTLKFLTLTLLAYAFAANSLPMIGYMVVFAFVACAFNVAFVARHPETFEPPGPDASSLKRQGTKLSLSGVFPLLLEHVDKLLISYFLGLEALGVYTLGVATGRLFLHMVRPVATVYFPILVDHRLSLGVLAAVGAGMTVFGLAASWLLQYYFSYVLGPKFENGYPMAAVLAAGLGVYSVGVLSYYSSVFHRDADIFIPTLTNVVTAVVITGYLLFAIWFGGRHALVLCAASYPLRELVNVIVITILNHRAQRNAVTGPDL